MCAVVLVAVAVSAEVVSAVAPGIGAVLKDSLCIFDMCRCCVCLQLLLRILFKSAVAIEEQRSSWWCLRVLLLCVQNVACVVAVCK